MISTYMMPLGMLICDPISDAVRIEWMLIVTGIFMFTMGFFLISNKALRKAGEPAVE